MSDSKRQQEKGNKREATAIVSSSEYSSLKSFVNLNRLKCVCKFR